MTSHRRTIAGAAGTLVILVVAAVAFVRSGRYDIGADAPHLPITLQVIESLRDHSTKSHSSGIRVPNLDDPAMISEGAEHYSAMCTGCHLAPGMTDTAIRAGLYPQPPDLSKDGIDDPAEAFWIIKHGIKMSAMPAWGKTHSDEELWHMVAFVRKMPGMTRAQYRQLGGSLPSEGHDHMQSAPSDGNKTEQMPGMRMDAPTTPETKAPDDHSNGNPRRH